jgi:hypothetical protein
MRIIKTLMFGVLFILVFFQCKTDHDYIMTYQLNGKTINYNDEFPQVMKSSEYRDDELACIKYKLGYNLSDFVIICLDSTFNQDNFDAPNIQVMCKMNEGDSIVEYEYLSGKVELKFLERKEEIKAKFQLKLVNKNDSTDVIELKDGVFQGPLNYSTVQIK